MLFAGRLFGIGVVYSLILMPLLYAAYASPTLRRPESVFHVGHSVMLAVGAFWVYLALFSFLRTMTKKSLAIGMAYIGALDAAVAKLEYISVSKLAIWHHSAVIYNDAYPPGTRGLRILRTALHPDETASGSIWFLVIAFVVLLIAGAWMARTREYPVAGAVA